MSSDQRWKWAGIVSVISVGGVLVTDIVANVVGGYISDQIKTWQVPIQPPAQNQAEAKRDASAANAEAVSSIPAPANETQVTMAAVAPKPEPTPMPPIDIPPEQAPETATAPEPMPLPPEPQQAVLTGTVDQVIDTATLKIQGETIELAGIKGLGSPYRDQLAKFIEEQGSQIRCEPINERYVCFVSNVDLGLAALTNGAARPAADATPQYRQAADEARRNRRGIFQ
jgi:endonuclease YncB( thermonuclease family)